MQSYRDPGELKKVCQSSNIALPAIFWNVLHLAGLNKLHVHVPPEVGGRAATTGESMSIDSDVEL